MHTKLAHLIEALNLEAVEVDVFLGHHPPGTHGQLFGGQIMAQSLIAAGKTVPSQRPPHSLHGYFLRPGEAELPVLLRVERIRDGRSFSTRRVVAIQRGRAIFNMDASFHKHESGLEHQFSTPEIQPPNPEEIPEFLYDEAFVSFNENWRLHHGRVPQPPFRHIWFKANGGIVASPLVHTALLTYQADNDLLSTARLPHLGKFDREHLQRASLDHAMWFHREISVDDWLMYDLDSPSTFGARGYNRGFIFDLDGSLVASTMQEGLMRLRTKEN